MSVYVAFRVNLAASLWAAGRTASTADAAIRQPDEANRHTLRWSAAGIDSLRTIITKRPETMNCENPNEHWNAAGQLVAVRETVHNIHAHRQLRP